MCAPSVVSLLPFPKLQTACPRLCTLPGGCPHREGVINDVVAQHLEQWDAEALDALVWIAAHHSTSWQGRSSWSTLMHMAGVADACKVSMLSHIHDEAVCCLSPSLGGRGPPRSGPRTHATPMQCPCRRHVAQAGRQSHAHLFSNRPSAPLAQLLLLLPPGWLALPGASACPCVSSDSGTR